MGNKAGVTLIELLVASLLAVIVMLGAAQLFRIYLQSNERAVSSMNQQISRNRVQTALQVLERELSTVPAKDVTYLDENGKSFKVPKPDIVGGAGTETGSIHYSQLNAAGNAVINRQFAYNRQLDGGFTVTYTNENNQTQVLLNGEVDQFYWLSVAASVNTRQGLTVAFHVTHDQPNSIKQYPIIFLNF